MRDQRRPRVAANHPENTSLLLPCSAQIGNPRRLFGEQTELRLAQATQASMELNRKAAAWVLALGCAVSVHGRYSDPNGSHIYTGEDLTGQMTCVDTCLWASVRACSHSHAHYSSSATAHLCRTARVTTADQAPSTVCAVWVLTARTAGAVRQRHRRCYHPHPRRHHLLCHRDDFHFTPACAPVPCYTLSLSG